MLHLGFSYVALIYALMLFVPNIIWSKNKPADYDKYEADENKILLTLERIGEGMTLVCALIFTDFNIRPFTLWSVWLIVSFVFMVLYELYWIRYFRSAKTMTDMYSSYAGFPVAGASLPCLAFFCLGIYGGNIFLIVSSLILSVGHIGIHLQHRRQAVPGRKTKTAAKVIGIIVLIPAALIFTLTIAVIAGRNINWFRSYIDTSKGIDEASYIEIGGQEQYVVIRGRDIGNPVILYLHGGPAGPDSAIMPVFTDPLIDDYTVVCWDQRGCGRTYFHNMGEDPGNDTVSFEKALSDTDELVDYLCERFGTDKVIVMGHSYGTIVGTRYVLEHPEKVLAYIGIGQFVNCGRSDELAYRSAYATAIVNGLDTSALEEAYKTSQEADDLEAYMTFRNATSQILKPKYNADTISLAVFSPYAGIDDIRWVLTQSDMTKYQALEKELMETIYTYDAYDYMLEYEVPMFFISGDMDYICNYSLAKVFCEDITAPAKEFVTFPGVGHTPQYTMPELFGETVKGMLESI